MGIISLIFTSLFLIIILLAFVNTKWSITLFIAYSLLVPTVQIFIGSVSIGSKFMYILLSLIFLLKYQGQIKAVSFEYFKPFILLYALLAVEIIFQPSGLMENNYSKLLDQILSCICYPMVIYSLISIERISFKYFLYAILISGTIFVGYGLFLTTMPGVNPYLMVTLPLFGYEFNEAYALGYSALSTSYGGLVEGRMFGRISSVFPHPMTYGLNLGLFAILLIYTFKEKTKIQVLLVAIIFIAILTSGIRTSFLAFILTSIVALVYLKKTKYAIYALGAGILFMSIVPMVSPEMNDFVNSMLGGEDSKTSGSSLSMRINQFYGCFDIIKDDLLFGKGYTWTSVYMATNTTHPVLLCFESLIFTVLCNNGLVGALIWSMFLISFYRMVKNMHVGISLQCMFLSLFVFYIFYSIITGDYGYLAYFMLYYAVALGYLYNHTEGLVVYEKA